MAKRIYAIAATEVIDTGTVSYGFMVHSKAPRDNLRGITHIFGVLTRIITPTGDGYWNLNVFESSRGQILGAGFSDYEAYSALPDALGYMPDGVLLLEQSLVEELQKACETAGITLEVFNYEGSLATSNEPITPPWENPIYRGSKLGPRGHRRNEFGY